MNRRTKALIIVGMLSSPIFMAASQQPTPELLKVPSLHISAKIITLGLTSQRTMEVPDSAEVAGWYKASPIPGEMGPAIIAAHVDWKGRAGVFINLNKIRIGEKIFISLRDGKTIKYRVFSVRHYSKDNFPTASVYGNINYVGLRLITCSNWSEQDRKYRDNLVVYARS